MLRVDGEVQFVYEVYSGPKAAPQAGLALRTQNHQRVMMLLVERVSQRFLLSALPSAPSVQTTLLSREVNAHRGPLLPDSNIGPS